VNRNKLMLLNAITVIGMTLIAIVLGMVEVKLLIWKYGSEVNGLMQTGNQLMSYLSLIESGICAAYLLHMYKAVAQKDDNRLSALYNGFTKSITNIVIKMVFCALVISLLYPLVLEKENLSYLYMMTVFILLSAKTILPYLIILVPKYMIILSEQKYKAELITGGFRVVTYGTEILLLIYTNLPLHGLLCACVLVSLMSGTMFQFVMRKLYKDRLDKRIAPDVCPTKMTKDVLVHNVSSMAFNSTDNIIISIFRSLEEVTVYSNYNMISLQVTSLLTNVIDGAAASMGIKIANGDKNSYHVYREIFTGTMWIGATISAVYFVMINDFIRIWVGNEYCLPIYNIVLFAVILFCNILFPALLVARNAKGLYKESKNFTILQALLNLGLTFLLVPKFGIGGALIGTVLARICITIPFNYRIVEKSVFANQKTKWYELLFGIIIVGISGTAGTMVKLLIESTLLSGTNIYLMFVLEAFAVSLIVGVVTVGLFYFLFPDYRRLLMRVMMIIKRIFYKKMGANT